MPFPNWAIRGCAQYLPSYLPRSAYEMDLPFFTARVARLWRLAIIISNLSLDWHQYDSSFNCFPYKDFFFLTYLVTTIRRWRGHCVFKLFDRDSESTSWFLPYGFLVLTLTTPQQDLFCFRSFTVTQTRPWTSLLTLINSNNLETAGIHLKS